MLFNGLDLAANDSTASYGSVLGTLGGSTVFRISPAHNPTWTGFGNFQTVGGGVSLDPIDALSVTVNDSVDTANIDNIVVAAIARGAQARVTITFDGLTGFHVPFTTYNEVGL